MELEVPIALAWKCGAISIRFPMQATRPKLPKHNTSNTTLTLRFIFLPMIPIDLSGLDLILYVRGFFASRELLRERNHRRKSFILVGLEIRTG